MLNKYQLNQLIFFSSFITLVVFYSLVLIGQIGTFLFPLFIIPIAFVIHYQYNAVHIASHMQMGKNSQYNNFIGHLASILSGATFAGFSTNHILHHKNPNDTDNDPDYQIAAKTPLFLIAFKIWYHDFSFFNKQLHLINKNYIGYALTRIIQISLILGIILSGNLSNFLFFWVLPVWLVGTLNGLFLFYFPHYTTPRVEVWKKLVNPNWFQKLSLVLIQISLFYHTKHHEKINGNRNYYPIFSYLSDSFATKKLLFIKSNV